MVLNVLNWLEEVLNDFVVCVSCVIEEFGYVCNDVVCKLCVGVSIIVGFVVFDGQNLFYSDVVCGVEDEVFSYGIVIFYGNIDEDLLCEKVYFDFFWEQQVCGLLIVFYGDVMMQL